VKICDVIYYEIPYSSTDIINTGRDQFEFKLFVIAMSTTRQWNESEPNSDEEINQETLSTRKRSSRGTPGDQSTDSLALLLIGP
jgi:hypothetical protein